MVKLTEHLGPAWPGFGVRVLVNPHRPVLAEVAGPAAPLVPPEDAAAWAAALTRVLADTALAARLTGTGAAVADAASRERGGRALHDLLLEVVAGGAIGGIQGR